MKYFLYSIPQAAEYCAIGRGTLWRWVKSGQLKASRTPGGHYRIRKTDLNAFILEKGMYPLAHNRARSNRILIADDVVQIQEVLSAILSMHGYETEVASNGFEVGIKTMRFKPVLIVMDLFMPGLNGFEVCKQMKQNPDTSHIKILAITGFACSETRDQSMKEGDDDFL